MRDDLSGCGWYQANLLSATRLLATCSQFRAVNCCEMYSFSRALSPTSTESILEEEAHVWEIGYTSIGADVDLHSTLTIFDRLVQTGSCDGRKPPYVL